MTPTEREIAEHLLACYDTIYIVLGESAPTLTNDAYVVRAYEMGSRLRRTGAGDARTSRAIRRRRRSPCSTTSCATRWPATPRGALVLYAMAMVVGPRLLVTLLEPRELTSRRGRCSDSSTTPRGLRARSSERPARWRRTRRRSRIRVGRRPARDLATTLDTAGNAESFGLSR